VILGCEVERCRLTPGLFELVVVLAFACGDGITGEVGDGLQQGAELCIGGVGRGLQRLQLVFERRCLERDGSNVLALTLQLAELLRECVALRLDGLSLGDGGAAFPVELREACKERRVRATLTKLFFH
jgi:hypothetical protein